MTRVVPLAFAPVDAKVLRLVARHGPVSAVLLVPKVWPSRMRRRHGTIDLLALRRAVLGCLGRLRRRGLVYSEPAGHKGTVAWRVTRTVMDL